MLEDPALRDAVKCPQCDHITKVSLFDCFNEHFINSVIVLGPARSNLVVTSVPFHSDEHLGSRHHRHYVVDVHVVQEQGKSHFALQ